MHGLGNDFVVIDARDGGAPVTPALARALGDRNRGIGFDQLAVVRPGAGVAAEVDFWNSDGTPADACGNATRCVARLLMEESGAAALDLRTGRGVLRAEDAGGGLIRVNMGPPELDWRTVPLAREMDLDALPIAGSPGAAGMGNPHCVFVVDDAETVDLVDARPADRGRTRSSRSAPTSSSSRSSTARRSACGSGSAAAWSRWPAAPGPARRWW